MENLHNASHPPRPSSYTDYREFLLDRIRYNRENQRGFSYRGFSRRAGFSSPNFLKLVAEGERNLSLRSLDKFARGLGLVGKDKDDFEILVKFCQADSDEERNKHYSTMRRRFRNTLASELRDDQFDVCSSWYVIPIREMMTQETFCEDPEWIAQRLRPRIRISEARRALEALEATGLAVRDERGRLVPANAKLTSGPHMNLAMRNYHRSMLERANESIERYPVSKRHLTSLTVPLSAAQYHKLAEKIQQFVNETLEEVDNEPDESVAQVHCLAFQLFPLTQGGAS